MITYYDIDDALDEAERLAVANKATYEVRYDHHNDDYIVARATEDMPEYVNVLYQAYQDGNLVQI